MNGHPICVRNVEGHIAPKHTVGGGFRLLKLQVENVNDFWIPKIQNIFKSRSLDLAWAQKWEKGIILGMTFYLGVIKRWQSCHKRRKGVIIMMLFGYLSRYWVKKEGIFKNLLPHRTLNLFHKLEKRKYPTPLWKAEKSMSLNSTL